MQTQNFRINETDFTVTTENGHIKDITVSTTPENYKNNLLPKLYDLGINTKNTPYARMFRNPLAQFAAKAQTTNLSQPMLNLKNRLDVLSGFYDRFDKFLNQVLKVNPIDCLDDLLTELKALKGELHPFIIQKEAICDLDYTVSQLHAIASQLITDIELFEIKIQALKDNVPTRSQVKQLMSIQDQDKNMPSLGTFVAEQLIKVASMGIKIAYHLSDNRIKDMIHVPPLVKALSDAKKMLELKARSLDGAEYNDAYSAMPLSVEAVIASREPSASVSFSLKPYLSSWNVSELDKLACLISNTSLDDRQTPAMWFDVLKLAASLLELALVMSIRLPVTFVLVCFDLVGRILSLDTDTKWTDSIDQTISDLHEQLSPVIAAKHLWNTRYKRNNLGGDHQQLLNTIKNESSHFHIIAKEYTASKIVSFLVASLKMAYQNIKQIPQDIRYLFSTAKAQIVFDDVLNRYQQSTVPTVSTLCSETILLPQYSSTNHIVSPFEVPREVVYAITDGMIDPFFRKSPATSTLFFALSATTFGTYLLPAALFAGIKSAVLGLQLPTNLLSKAFTGRLMVEGMQDASVACFLEWQALALLTELGIEIYEDDLDVLAQMFQEPEKISMALVSLVAIGMGLQFIPTVPSSFTIPGTSMQVPIVYTSLLNLFTEEAKSSTHGVYPFSLITKLILGLKAALLTHSMLAGAEHSDAVHNDIILNTFNRLVDENAELLQTGKTLAEALSMLSNPHAILDFSCDPLNGQRKFYDNLNTLFDKYNHELQRRGRADLCLDKHDVLDVFYNKYCKKEVNNVLCILSIFPLYPATLLWRSIKWLWATAYHKPSIAHEVEVQFYKDAVLALQVVAMMTKTLYSVGLAVSYTIRPIAALALFAVTVIPYLFYRLGALVVGYDDVMTRKSWFQAMDEMVCKIKLHDAQLDRLLRPIYAHAARIAGSNTNVAQMSLRAQNHLLQTVEGMSAPIQDSRKDMKYIDTSSQLGCFLERHDRTVRFEPEKVTKIRTEGERCFGNQYHFFALSTSSADEKSKTFVRQVIV